MPLHVYLKNTKIMIWKDTWTSVFMAALLVKDPTANAGDAEDMGSIPGSGRSPGGGHGNPLQYSCLENPHEQIGGAWRAIVHWVTKSWACLKQHYYWVLLSHEKEQNVANCNNMDGPEGHYSKWKKSNKDILYNITYMWKLKNTVN